MLKGPTIQQKISRTVENDNTIGRAVIGLTALGEEVGKSQNVSVCWLLLAVLASHFKKN